jgi:hypothetical protein
MNNPQWVWPNGIVDVDRAAYFWMGIWFCKACAGKTDGAAEWPARENKDLDWRGQICNFCGKEFK